MDNLVVAILKEFAPKSKTIKVDLNETHARITTNDNVFVINERPRRNFDNSRENKMSSAIHTREISSTKGNFSSNSFNYKFPGCMGVGRKYPASLPTKGTSGYINSKDLVLIYSNGHFRSLNGRDSTHAYIYINDRDFPGFNAENIRQLRNVSIEKVSLIFGNQDGSYREATDPLSLDQLPYYCQRSKSRPCYSQRPERQNPFHEQGSTFRSRQNIPVRISRSTHEQRNPFCQSGSRSQSSQRVSGYPLFEQSTRSHCQQSVFSSPLQFQPRQVIFNQQVKESQPHQDIFNQQVKESQPHQDIFNQQVRESQPHKCLKMVAPGLFKHLNNRVRKQESSDNPPCEVPSTTVKVEPEDSSVDDSVNPLLELLYSHILKNKELDEETVSDSEEKEELDEETLSDSEEKEESSDNDSHNSKLFEALFSHLLNNTDTDQVNKESQ